MRAQAFRLGRSSQTPERDRSRLDQGQELGINEHAILVLSRVGRLRGSVLGPPYGLEIPIADRAD